MPEDNTAFIINILKILASFIYTIIIIMLWINNRRKKYYKDSRFKKQIRNSLKIEYFSFSDQFFGDFVAPNVENLILQDAVKNISILQILM